MYHGEDISEKVKVDSHFIGILVHFRNYLSANIAQKVIGLISLPVMTRLLSPAEYGAVNVFTSYIGILVVILSLNSYTSIGRYWYERKNDFNLFMGSSFCLVAGTLFFSFLLFVMFRKPLSNILSMSETLVILLLPLIAINIVNSVFRQVYEPQRKSGLIGKLNVVEGCLGFTGSVAFVLMMKGDRYYGVIWGQLVAGVVVSVVMIKLLMPHFKLAFYPKHVHYILGYSAPLIPDALSAVILAQFDRVMINGYIGSNAAGLYSLAYNIGMLLLLVNAALLTAWTPYYFEDMDHKKYDKLDSDIDKIFRLILIGAMFLMVFGQEVGLILADKKYHVALSIIPIVVFGHIFHALFQLWGRNIGYARKTIWAPIISLIAGFTNIVLNAIFIPMYGYAAAAYTTVVSYMLMAFMGWGVSKYIVRLYTTPLQIIMKPLGILVILYSSLIAIELAGLGLWMMMAVKLLLFCIFSATMIWRYVPGIFEIIRITHSK
jgi:O-antigen/teichoic acid export membrane protein